VGRFYGGRRINASGRGVRKCQRRRRSVLEYGPALRTLRVRLFHVGAAVRAGERGRLGGLAAERQRRIRARFGSLLCTFYRNRFRSLGHATRRLGAGLSGTSCVPPQEQDGEVEQKRGQNDAVCERDREDEETIQRPTRSNDGPQISVREGPVPALIPH